MVRPGATTAAIGWLLIVTGVLAGCAASQDTGQQTPTVLGYEVVAELPADPNSFTQGLEFDGQGRLFETSGGYGRSTLRQIDPADGTTVATLRLDDSWFAEGLTVADTSSGEAIVMLTWREGVVVHIDPDTLTERRRLALEGEGWGVCELSPGTLVVSDGSSTLTFRNTDTLAVESTVQVTRTGEPVARLNELECVDGEVWANVWMTDNIVVIDPADGVVVAELDASGLLDRSAWPGADVLNGIAAVPGKPGEFLLAGKLWPSTWHVRVGPQAERAPPP